MGLSGSFGMGERRRNDPRRQYLCSKADLPRRIAAGAQVRPMMTSSAPRSFGYLRIAALTRSLSVLLPVHNAQATLQSDVGRMLDLLPDLSRNFDLMIIDDGSTDDTSEIAEDLTAQFPQVKLMRSSRRQGVEASIRNGLAKTSAHVVLAHNGQSSINESEVWRVWSQKDDSSPAGFRVLRRDPPVSQPAPTADAGHRLPQNRKPAPARPAFLARLKNFTFGQ